MNKTKPQRVSTRYPCPICGHPDWCMVGDAYILCMRVESDRPKLLKGGEAGWLHRVGDYKPPVKEKEKEKPVDINFDVMMHNWKRLTISGFYLAMEKDLGIPAWTLQCMGAAWAQRYQAAAFPMRDGNGGVIGIRLRSKDGKKWAVPGSHQGLFLPNVMCQAEMMICEGPTDTAAAISMGCFAVGRPSCCGGVEHIQTLVKRIGVRRVLVIADLDDPGLRGATTLVEHLAVPSAVLALPAKDMREFVKAGGTRAVLDSLAKQLIWRQPNDNARNRMQA